MDQLRTSDLFRYRQTYQQHKQKIKNIMNRSSESIHQLTEKQKQILTKNNKSHEKALKFKLIQKQRQISIINTKFVDRIYSNDQKRTKILNKQKDHSRSESLLARSNLLRSSAQLMNSRTTVIKQDNSFINKKLSDVKSTISLKDFSREYDRHAERSSMLSKFKIDARSFKFIAKNQIVLEKIANLKPAINTSRSRISESIAKSGFITQRLPQRHSSLTKIKQPLMKLSLPNSSIRKISPNSSPIKKFLPINSPIKKLEFKTVKLQQLSFSKRKYQAKTSTLMKISNPQSSVRKIKFNNF